MNPAPADKGGERIARPMRIELAARKLAMLLALTLAAAPAAAQDIAGLEDCAQARGPDKKIGCLQSNVEFLHKLIKTNDTATQAKLAAANVKIAELQAQIERLKTALDQLEKKIPPPPTTARPTTTPPATSPAAKP
jgi:septal ring factor EnvC (AmiA/AmiB activator)